MNKAPLWVWASLAACVAACLVSLYFRHAVEVGNRAVGVMMEMDELEALAASSGQPLETVLANLKEHGLVGVSVPEETVADLIADGRLVAGPSGDTLSGVSAQRAFQYLSLYTKVQVSRDPSLLLLSVPVKSVLHMPVGLDPRETRAAQDAGLVIVARHTSFPGMGRQMVRETLRMSHELGATAYLIGGSQAIGNRDLIDDTSRELKELGMFYLSPEFVELGGDAYLRNDLAPQTMRLHSIQQGEAEQMSEAAFEERMVKAFKERDCRWLLIRRGTEASADPVRDTGESLFDLKKALQRAGGELKPPRPFDQPKTPGWLIGLIGLLAAPTVGWTVASVVRNRFGLVVGILSALLMGLDFTALRGVAALVAATALPVFGYLVMAHMKRSQPVLQYLTVSGLSLVGGLIVAATLVGQEYMLRVHTFTGVKIAVFVPIIVVGALVLAQFGGLKRYWRSPVAWGATVLVIVGLAALYMLFIRSGNDNPAAVSPLELRFRDLLDALFVVRPRTKEIFFGHPALVLGLCIAAYRPHLRGWAALLIIAGMIGQTSIVNTLCHLHTPVVISLARIAIGVMLGGIIGVALWLFLRRTIPEPEAETVSG